MDRPGYLVAFVLAVAAPLLAVSGCGTPDQVDSSCTESLCSFHVRSGTSLNIDGLELNVEEVSDDYVTLSSHGMRLELGKKLDVRLGSHRIHLVGTGGGAADIQIR
ncbi:hypothetical protein GCM10010129_39410 [Streptomyces fumigatiscleroticus]|nr:hypothetical protein GCM10010129_39410 [Streptomyces fumigatiscleroticus]